MAKLDIKQILSDRLLFFPLSDQPLSPQKKHANGVLSSRDSNKKEKRKKLRSSSDGPLVSKKMRADACDVPAALRRLQVEYGDDSDEEEEEEQVLPAPRTPQPTDENSPTTVEKPVTPIVKLSPAKPSPISSPSFKTATPVTPAKSKANWEAKRLEVLKANRVRLFSEGAEEAISFFGQSKNVDYYSWDGLRDIKLETFPGLPNEAANCYMLTGLQMLFAVPAFFHILNEHRDCSCEGMCVIGELHRFVRIQERGDYELKHVGRLKRAVGFSHSNTEEDLHEFLMDLLSKVGGVFESRNRMMPPKANPVEKVFGGCLRTQLKCLRCSHNAIRYENIMNLYLEVSSSVHLNNCVRGFFEAERISDFRCERCGPASSVEKSSRVMRTPSVLMVMLKRFTPSRQKITDPFNFTETLDLSAYTMHGGGCASYTLLAVGEHLGGSIRHGHYAALVRGAKDPTKWFRKDDDIVSEERRGGAVGKNAYVLLYQRDDLCKDSLKMAARRQGQPAATSSNGFPSSPRPVASPKMNGIKPFQIKNQERPGWSGFKPRPVESNNWKAANGFTPKKNHFHPYKFKSNGYNNVSNHRYFRH